MSRTVTCTVWHPYPTYRWEYKQSGDWADVQGYALYESGYDTKTLHLKEEGVVEGDEGRVRCAISNPTGTVTYSDEVPITVGALAWETDLVANVTKTVTETVPGLQEVIRDGASWSAEYFPPADAIGKALRWSGRQTRAYREEDHIMVGRDPESPTNDDAYITSLDSFTISGIVEDEAKPLYVATILDDNHKVLGQNQITPLPNSSNPSWEYNTDSGNGTTDDTWFNTVHCVHNATSSARWSWVDTKAQVGKTYRVSFEARVVDETPCNVNLRIYSTTQNDRVVHIFMGATGVWQKLEAEYTEGGGGTDPGQFQIRTDIGGGNFEIRDCSFREVLNP